MTLNKILPFAWAFCAGFFCCTAIAVVSEEEAPPIICDNLEESRLRIALNECSDAVMTCAWGDHEPVPTSTDEAR